MRCSFRMDVVLTATVVFLSGLSVRGDVITGGHDLDALPPVVGDGESLAFYAPHHGPDAFHSPHYFAMTGDVHHFAWFSSTPATPGPIVIKYDFRPDIYSIVAGGSNTITPAEMARATDALTAWSAATGGKVTFMLDTVAPYSSIINIGSGVIDGVGGILGLGGGAFSHGNPGTHSITGGVAFQDSSETWDTMIGNGNPLGTFDYFTVVAQEIGHALGLGHTDNDGSSADDIMDGSYVTAKDFYSTDDIDHITSVYGVASSAVIPEPASLTLLSIGGLALLGTRWRGRRVQSATHPQLNCKRKQLAIT